MDILKIVLHKISKIIGIVPATELEKLQDAKTKSDTCPPLPNEVIINPATGLPMIGCFDSAGNLFGSNNTANDVYYRNQQDNYYHHSSSNTPTHHHYHY